MRVVHLCFQLHEPYHLQDFAPEQPYFENKETFERANREIYQPLFALIERNTQKNRNFRVSLTVSGTWIELAERYDAELIRRLKKLVNLGQVELVAEPFYHSLAFFFDKNEFSQQVKQYQAKVQALFGAKTQIFCLPEFIYNDAIAKWAEDFGFAGMLAGNSVKALGWHSANHVYEAANCEYLRVLFRNGKLSDAIMQSKVEIMAERVDKEKQTKKMSLSWVDFRKLLDLECLRGGLQNIYLDARCIGKLREVGIIAFFDEFFEQWLEDKNNKFATASMACVVEAPTMELTIPEAISWYDADEAGSSKAVQSTDKTNARETRLTVKAGQVLPNGFNSPEQLKLLHRMYDLRRGILATEDESLIDDYQHLLAADFVHMDHVAQFDNLRKIFDDLSARAEAIKKQQVVEISKVFTKRRDRGMAEENAPEMKAATSSVVDVVGNDHDGSVSVHFGTKKAEEETVKKTVSEPTLCPSAKSVAEPIVRSDTKPVAEPMTRQARDLMTTKARPITVIDGDEASEDNAEPEAPVRKRGDDVDEMMNWSVAREGKTAEQGKKGFKHSIKRVIRKLVIE